MIRLKKGGGFSWMTALVASLAKAFRDIGAFMMRCPHNPSDSH
jgi:hypothetical protein